ncbi:MULTISPECIES: Rossmann fold domain-containing protein [unclassified Sphingomonas]|uniref:Rossmann fold domain-containing protein n=1 Tax=unclassified Sphingomonas TaxID=196159 RepID=UPI0006F84E14|nr:MULTISPECIES: hypothetical protein [unclassified Sphingomonas]KQN22480.1 hypothetical protein ASE89_06285 [Sphingomonas sp. Leaf30]MBD8549196.1 hypothetical protein [Sphingomonas sp. CFBP 8764]
MRLILSERDDIAACVRDARARLGNDDSLVVVIRESSDSLFAALARALIAPLAIEAAPVTRINAVLSHNGARAADVEVAISYLETALSTTGQILEIR